MSTQPAGSAATTSGHVTVAVLTERAAGEQRVALVPETVAKLVADGVVVRVERGAGAAAHFSDVAYEAAGAVLGGEEILSGADVLLAVRRPVAEVTARLTAGQTVIALLDARGPGRAELDPLVDAGVRLLSLDLLPRTLSRAQTMDALTSQASVAGYRSVLVAAEAFAKFFPMMITAAGTARPAKVLVLGAGVAGLQAIGTAKRLGAQVTGYDVRESSRDEVTSLGASFLSTSVHVESVGGYARALTDEERAAQQAEIAAATTTFDIVITTAQVPGGRPPVLVTAETVAAMAPGSVLVDIAASPLGGNVEGSVAGERIVTPQGVTVIGAGDLPSQMATAASAAYSRNVAALLTSIVTGGELVLDTADEVVDAVWLRPADAAPADSAPADEAPADAQPATEEK